MSKRDANAAWHFTVRHHDDGSITLEEWLDKSEKLPVSPTYELDARRWRLCRDAVVEAGRRSSIRVRWNRRNTRLGVHLGQFTALLIMMVEDVEIDDIPRALINIMGLAYDERPWCYLMVAKYPAWRKALRIAFLENPVTLEEVQR